MCGFLVNESGVWCGASARLVPAMGQLVGSSLAEGTAVRLGWKYRLTGREFFSASCCFAFVFFWTQNRLNETTFSAILYFIKISMQYMNWGGKCSPERLMQFSYFTWTTAFLPHYSWETALTSHSTQQFTGFQWGGVGLQTWHRFLAVSTGHFSIWRVPSIQGLNYCHLEGNQLIPVRSHCTPGHLIRHQLVCGICH